MGKHIIPDALCFWDQITERPWIFESSEILVPRRKVERLPMFEGSCWQISIAEGGARFSVDDRWLLGGLELNFNVRLEIISNKM